MTIQLDEPLRHRPDGTVGSAELRITAPDVRTARHIARVVEDVRGEPAGCVADRRTVLVRGVDARAAVDVLAELAWAGALPESFSLR